MKISSLDSLPIIPTSHSGAGSKKVFIPEHTLPRLYQFAQVTFKPGEIAKEHKHDDFYEVLLAEKGNGTIRVEGKEYPFTAGTSIALEPGELHEVVNNGQELLVITFFSIFVK